MAGGRLVHKRSSGLCRSLTVWTQVDTRVAGDCVALARRKEGEGGGGR